MKHMTTAIVAAAALVVGVASGAAMAGEPVHRAPIECVVALNTANKLFIAQTNVVGAVQARATRGKAEFAEHDAEVTRLLDEVDELAPTYNDNETACLESR